MKILLILVLLTSAIQTAIAQQPLVLQKGQDIYATNGFLETLEDTSGDMDFESVLISPLWKPHDEKEINFGISKSVFWVRIKIHNPFPENLSFLYEIEYPHQDYIDGYLMGSTGKVEKWKLGDRRPFRNRPYPVANFVFDVTVPADGFQHIYFRLWTHDGLYEPLPMTIFTKKAFIFQQNTFRMGISLYFGVILAMLFYNAFILVILRSRVYLYYVLYLFSYGLFSLHFYGIAAIHFWGDYPGFSQQLLLFSLIGCAFFLVLFVRAFLETKTSVPKIDRILLFIMALLVSLEILVLADYYLASLLSLLGVVFIGIPILFIVGLVVLQRGYRQAIYFLVAFSVLLLSIFVSLFKVINILPSSFIINNSIIAGSMVEVILLSLSLADRINQEKKAKEMAQKEAIESQKEAIANLHKADKLKDEFLSNTSHELRTPLHGIIGISQNLIDGAAGTLSDLAIDNLRLVVNSGQRLAHLINGILDFSKLKNREVILQMQSVDIHTLTNLVIALCQPMVAEKNLSLENKIPRNLPLAFGDEDRLQQIMFNLIGNAIRFTQEGKVVVEAEVRGEGAGIKESGKGIKEQEVENSHNEKKSKKAERPYRIEEKRERTPITATFVSGPSLLILVKDTGIGIPEEKLSTIFLPFEQSDGSIERTYGGSGLGLAITKNLVELHGGEIWVESLGDFETGSTFYFTLPIDPAQGFAFNEQKTAPSADNEYAYRRGYDIFNEKFSEDSNEDFAIDVNEDSHRGFVEENKFPPKEVLGQDLMDLKGLKDNKNSTGSAQTEIVHKILIVDDDPVNLQVILNILTDAQMTAITVSSGAEALKAIRHNVPDLVLLDIMMPRMNGYETARRIRETFSLDTLPIIFLTARNQAEALLEGYASGGSDFITKPFSKQELISRVNLHLNLKLLAKNKQFLSVGQAASGIVHDLKNSIYVIKTYSQMLMQYDFKNKKRREYLLSIETELNRLTDMAQSILNFVKGETKVYPEKTQIIPFVEEVVNFIRPSFESFHKKIKVNTLHNGSVFIDRNQMRRAIVNVANNAREALPEGGVLSISAISEGGFFSLQCEDDGSGIPESIQARVFQPFFTFGRKTGIGLGLVIAKQIVEAHGGNIRVESPVRDGKGTRIVFELGKGMMETE